MKRTFTVTIDDDEPYTAEDIRNALDLYADQTNITVTETTAVHHAERMVINRALIWDAPWFSEKRTPKLQQAVRELRALMEGKA